MGNLSLILSVGLLLNAYAAKAPESIEIPEALSEEFEFFEPSAAIYAKDLDGFLVASDDTDEEDRPFLFLMDAEGALDEEPLKVKGLKKMTDIESLSADASGNLYLLSSLGLNKNGKEKPERNYFVKATRSGREIKVTESLELRSRLLEALEELNLPDPTENLDVEAHFVNEGNLYLGLKNPQPKEGTAVIVSLGKVNELFKSKEISKLKIWKSINFKSISKEADALSDMQLVKGHLLLTTTTEAGDSRFWKYDLSSDKLTLLKSFAGQKAEAIVPNAQGEKALLLFDQGEEEPLFTYTSASKR